MAWSIPAVRTASSPAHFARNQTLAPSGAAAAPDENTNLRARAPTAAWTSLSVPRWSNSSNVKPLRGFSTGNVGNVRTWTTVSAPATARGRDAASRTSPWITLAPIDSIRAREREG